MAGVKNKDVDRINIKENTLTSIAGKTAGKRVSAFVDVTMALVGPGKALQKTIKNSGSVISYGKILLNKIDNAEQYLKTQ